MKNKILIVLIPVIILVGISAFLGSVAYKETKKIEYVFKGETISGELSIIEKQKEINKKLYDIQNNKSYTFEKAYVKLNPYNISPLSAIIIFYTNKASEVDVFINEEHVTKMAPSQKHAIPIYGLFENYENKVKLVMDKKEVVYTIKTEASGIQYPLEILEKSNVVKHDNLLFTVASYSTWLTGWDLNGKLRFYLTEDYRMDVEWLDNGHFIIGTTQGQFAENFLGFVEMDYLGKIYNYYTMENGFSFESQVLSNGNIMSAGGDKPVYVKEQVVYEMNPKTGVKVSEINFNTIFLAIDPKFETKYLGQAAIRNGFYYNEKTNEMIVSFRGINTIFCVDYKEKKLKWIFTDPNNEVFKEPIWNEYKVISKNGSYPWGQHSPKITKEGYIAFFNNGYDRYHGFEAGGEDKVSAYQTNYSRAEIYEIKDKQANLLWSYDENKTLFSHQYGSIEIDDENNKLINFGYVLKDTYRRLDTATLSLSEQNPDNIYAYILEVNAQNQVIFKAKCEEGKYRVFKHGLYKKETENIMTSVLHVMNSIPDDELESETLKTVSLNHLEEWIYTTQFTKNTFVTNYEIQEDDTIDLYFVNKSGAISILHYKKKEDHQKNRIFHVNLTGQYAFYIGVNDKIYNPNLNIKF